jgi:hypothetical protein
MTEKKAIYQSGTQYFPLNHQGIALMLCLLLMATLCLVGGAALGVSGLNRQIVHNGTKQARAFYVAEAGRQTALACLKEEPMWRGDEPITGSFVGGLAINDVQGAFDVSVSDCTADENGKYNAFLPAGHVLLESTGGWGDASQTVSCIAIISPAEASAASFPHMAVVSTGPISGALTALGDLGDENPMLIQSPAVLPAANTSGLKAMAEFAFSSLDDDAWDAALDDINSFWLDAQAEARPRILSVEGDLKISGERQLYGVVFVGGREVYIGGEAGIEGVLYAPNATNVTIDNTGASGRTVVNGLIVVGSGGVTVSGNPVSIQCCPDYVDAFRIAAGSEVNVEVAPGAWTSF